VTPAYVVDEDDSVVIDIGGHSTNAEVEWWRVVAPQHGRLLPVRVSEPSGDPPVIVDGRCSGLITLGSRRKKQDLRPALGLFGGTRRLVHLRVTCAGPASGEEPDHHRRTGDAPDGR